MPYAPTDWVDGVTPVNAFNLDKLEAGVANAVEKPAGIVDGESVQWDADTSSWKRSTAGDFFRVAAGGFIIGGDVNLYRSSANELRTDDAFTVMGTFEAVGGRLGQLAKSITDWNTATANGWYMASPGTNAPTELTNWVIGEVWNHGAAGYCVQRVCDFTQSNGSQVYERRQAGGNWTAWVKIGLYNPAANQVKTDYDLYVPQVISQFGTAQQIQIANDGRIYFGGASDVNLYRYAADILKTDDALRVALGITTNDGSPANEILLWTDGKIYLGGDVNLYRSAANKLKTDDSMEVAQSLQALVDVLGNNSVYGAWTGSDWAVKMVAGAKPGLVFQTDVNLYRAAADQLKTDDRLIVGTDLAVVGGIGTALPASPVDGQLFTLTDSLTVPTYAWQLRYIAAASKWFYIGGAPRAAAVATLENTASTTYTDLTTAGPSVTAPRAGDYRIAIGATPNNLTGGQSADMSFAIGATAAVDADRVRHTSSAAGAATSVYRELVKNLAAGTTLTMKYKATGGTAYFSDRGISIYPVWLT